MKQENLIVFNNNDHLSGDSLYRLAGSPSPKFLIKKTSANKEKLIQQYQWLLKRQGFDGIPKVGNPREHDETFSYEIKYLPEAKPLFKVLPVLSHTELSLVAGNLLKLLQSTVYNQPAPQSKTSFIDYCKLKLFKTLEDCFSEHNHLFQAKKIIVNNKSMDNFFALKEPFWSLICSVNSQVSHGECLIHGDLTGENILINRENELFLIDPNPNGLWSHPVMDLAKLWQSFHMGFEINKNISVDVDGLKFSFKESHCSSYSEIRSIFTSEFKKYYQFTDQEIALHELVHIARLLPYAKNKPRGLFLWSYLKLVELANDILEISHQ